MKIDRLRNLEINKFKVQNNWLKNLIGREIPDDLKLLLSLGPKFSLQPTIKDIQIPKSAAEIDPAINKVRGVESDILLAQISLQTFYIKINALPVPQLTLASKQSIFLRIIQIFWYSDQIKVMLSL